MLGLIPLLMIMYEKLTIINVSGLRHDAGRARRAAVRRAKAAGGDSARAAPPARRAAAGRAHVGAGPGRRETGAGRAGRRQQGPDHPGGVS